MSKKESNIFNGIGTAAITIVSIMIAAYLYFENIKNRQKIKELEEDKLKLILDSLQNNSNLSEELKSQLQKLITGFKDIDEKISNELAQALQLFQIGQVENAIEDLVKIIEHMLKLHYKENNGFLTWLKEKKAKRDLHSHLTFCKEEAKITDIEFQFFIAIKSIRNKEAHELDVKIDQYLQASGLIIGLGGIFKIASIVYPKKLTRS